MGDDREFIDLDSTQNWSQLDVKRELDNLERDAETGKRYDYARGFSEDLKEKEDKIILDGLTSGLNYIPEEFLMAADEKKEAEIEKIPEEERPDVSWAYRSEEDEPSEDEPFIPLVDIKKAEAEAERIRSKEVVAVTEKEAEIEAIRAKNLEEQARRLAEANASDEIVKANIEARKKLREAVAAQNEAEIRANAEARKEAQRQAEIEMYSNSSSDAFSNQILDLDDLDVPVVTKEERIAAANKNGHNVTEKIGPVEDIDTTEETVAPVAVDASEEPDIPEVTYEIDEADKMALSTGDTGVIYLDDNGEEISPVASKEPEKVDRFESVGAVSEEYAAWADSDDEEEIAPKKKKVKRVKKEKKEKKISGLDLLVICTGVLVVVVAIATLLVYSSSRSTQARMDEFALLGQKMQTIGVSGSGKLTAAAEANRTIYDIEVPQEEVIEEPVEEEPVEYNEKEEDKTVSVTMTLTSVKKDLKIKFLNAKTKKLVGNYEFKVSVEDAKGKKYTALDDDKDGIIYLNSVEPGKAKVAMEELKDAKDLKYSAEAVVVSIKENIDYKKVDVADEVKTEAEINVKKEDTAVGLATEASLKDTVRWTETTKKLKDDAKLKKIDVSKLDNLPGKEKVVTPAAEAGSENVTTETPPEANNTGRINGLIDSIKEFWCIKVLAEHSEHSWDEGTVTTPATCTEGGVVTYKCILEDCQETRTDSISKINHDYGEDGKCKVCGETNPENGPAPTPEASPEVSPEVTPGVITAPDITPTASVSPTVSADGCVHKIGTDGYCKLCGQFAADLTTQLLYKGEPVYLDEEGTKIATYEDYFNGVRSFYYKPEVDDVGGDSSLYIYTGWQVIDGVTYYFDNNGKYVTGEQVIQGAKYIFDSNGALMKGSGTMGIDVSKWNGDINWTAVKNSGVSFVIVRCGYRGSSSGALVEDPKFRTNIKGAIDAGLKVGVYFFSQAVTDVEAVEEASMAINLMKGYKISYPVFLDVEDSGGRGDRIDANTRTQVIKAFCETLKNSGYTPGVYANKEWLNNRMNVGSLGGYKIWLAQYNTEPTYTGRYDIWQYSSKGTVGGIGGRTDMNLSYLGY